MASEPLRTPFERFVGVTLKALIFTTFLWGTAIVLAGHFILLHPSRHISSLLPPYGIFSNLSASDASNGNGDLLIGHNSSLLGDPLRFHLDTKWDIHAAPMTRVYNWSEIFLFVMSAGDEADVSWPRCSLAVSEIWGKPGHINKRMLVVNGISPGPTIQANFGDRIIVSTLLQGLLTPPPRPSTLTTLNPSKVNVVNHLENETALHWHGQFQNGALY